MMAGDLACRQVAQVTQRYSLGFNSPLRFVAFRALPSQFEMAYQRGYDSLLVPLR